MRRPEKRCVFDRPMCRDRKAAYRDEARVEFEMVAESAERGPPT